MTFVRLYLRATCLIDAWCLNFNPSKYVMCVIDFRVSFLRAGPSIMLELMQNADDAGATEASFLLDTATYPANSILGPTMSAWQGPALCCHNNAVFATADFHNISRIGQDSKLSSPTSVGRFGLGFNSVYHFTDVPSFVSGNHLVVFDPHARWVLPCWTSRSAGQNPR